MNLLKYLLSIYFAVTCIQSHSQNIGDTLFATREKGVTIYLRPDFTSTHVGKLKLNTEIIIKEKLHLDTSQHRTGNWYKIKSKSVKRGYAFGGFFNRQKIIGSMSSLEEAIQSLESQYSIQYSTFYGKAQEEIQVDDIGVHISGSRSHIKIQEDFWEGNATEIFFFDIELNEMLNIIETIKVNGSSLDYDRIVESANTFNLTKFEWINGADDWLTRVTLEKGPTTGVRIFMVAGL